jgi:intracellular sulfur oxidation DsrE/DsrF family protein
MQRIFLLTVLLFGTCSLSFSQNIAAIFKTMKERGVYPVMKSHVLMGVVPVDHVTLSANPKQVQKIAIDMVAVPLDSTKINYGITEIGRTFNLHVVNGTPKEKIEMVVIVHGPAIKSFLKDDAFEQEYKMKNPNLAFIDELHKNGVTFYVCGQNLAVMGLDKNLLTPELQLTLSAKTTVTNFQAKGYSFLYFAKD